MATPADYTAGANALLTYMLGEEQKLPPWIENLIPQDKLPAAAGAAAKVVIDAVDAHRAKILQEH